ncbi:MAG: DUF4347 domain-containing protein, partial [Planctomycetota bacterium]|nr:DUF4347 domain-containing protein [Planctomycetota bacterium]
MRLFIRLLEERIVLDAADLAEHPDGTDAEALAERSPIADSDASDLASPSSRREIVFVDASVEDRKVLLEGVETGVEVFVLEGEKDGWSQIEQLLEGRTELDAIHIVSHGSVGQAHLGNGVLNSSTIGGYASQLASIGNSLSESGDLLLYGCRIGQGEGGAAFLGAFSRLTGADVAASSDWTGALKFGGDWDLEVEEGEIETDSRFSDGQSKYDRLLPPPADFSVAATDASKAEGDSGNAGFTFTVTRGGDTTVATSVDYAVTGSGGDPVNAADFGGALPSGTVSFAAGETSKVITANVSGDVSVENDEAFLVTLSNPQGSATISTATATGTIQNDDIDLDLAATNANQAEGDSGNTGFTFTVTRAGDTSGATTVDYAVTGSGGNPANATDFGGALPTGTVSFSAGEASKVVTVNVSGDTNEEPDEGFTVTLSNPSGNAEINTATATGTIQKDDPKLSIAATSANQAEGDTGNTGFTFTV